MSKNPVAGKAAVSPPSIPAFLPSIIATAILSLALGYWVGVGNSILSWRPSTEKRRRTKKGKTLSDDGASSSEGLSSEEEEGDSNGGQLLGLPNEECKLVLVVRTDLGMTKGKVAAQCGHATLACYKSALKHQPMVVRRWETSGQMKVALQAKSEDELLILQAAAMSLNLTAKMVHDAGRTQIAAGSATVLGIGPGPKSIIDQVTGSLRLY